MHGLIPPNSGISPQHSRPRVVASLPVRATASTSVLADDTSCSNYQPPCPRIVLDFLYPQVDPGGEANQAGSGFVPAALPPKSEEERREREKEREVEREKEREKEQEWLKERAREQREELEKEKIRQRERVLQAEREKARVREQPQPLRRAKTVTSRTTGAGPSLAGGYALPGLQTKVTTTSESTAQSPGGLTENWSPVAPSPPVEVRQSRSMSSSSDEGPEEVGAYVPSRGLQQRIAEMGFSNASTRQEREESAAKAPARDRSPEKTVSSGSPSGVGGPRRMHNGRQNSVHDLVDLWGGSSTAQQLQDKKPVLPTKLSDKRRSAIVSSSSMKPPVRPTPTSSLAQSVNPPSPSSSPTSQAHVTGRPLPQPPSAQQQRPESPAMRSSTHILTPSTSLDSGRSPGAVPRARPQSMFVNPIARTTPLESTVSQHPTSIVEEGGEKQRRSTRRTSISDMVQRYEAIKDSGAGKTTAPPLVATKPVGLTTKTFSMDTTSSDDLPSPSAAATRFPKLSPPSSPSLSRATLAPPHDDPRPAAGRVSPSPRVLTRAPPAVSRAAEQLTGASTGGLSGRRTPLETSRVSDPGVFKLEGKPSQESKHLEQDSQVREPSPEKPFRGVSKLIDRWQRAVNEESSTTNRGPQGGFVATKTGTVANNSLRGR